MTTLDTIIANQNKLQSVVSEAEPSGQISDQKAEA